MSAERRRLPGLRALRLGLVVFAILVVLAPAAQARPLEFDEGSAPPPPAEWTVPDRVTTGDADPTRSLGTDSPMCAEKAQLQKNIKQACDLSGSIAHAYPLGHYGIDVQIDVGIDHLWDTLMAVIQGLGALFWLFLVHAFNAVLLLLEWAFSLDLLGNDSVMLKLREGMRVMHERVLGDAWTLAALGALSLWGIWWGLVRGKTIETISGVGASVALMIVALAIIYRPEVTVQPFSQLINDASMQVFTGISSGTINRPVQGFADAEQSIFNAVILRPWCALEFGDVDFCLSQRSAGSDDKGNVKLRQKQPTELSVADAWLEHAPNSLGRQHLYRKIAGKEQPVPTVTSCPPSHINNSSEFDFIMEETKKYVADWNSSHGTNIQWDTDENINKVCEYLKQHPGELTGVVAGARELVWKNPDKVSLQESRGTFARMAVLALIIGGLAAAIPLFAYLAIRLMLAAVFTLLLLMMAPVVFLTAALGNAGRQTFVAWFRRLLGQIIAKLVYALFLAVIVLEANILSSLS